MTHDSFHTLYFGDLFNFLCRIHVSYQSLECGYSHDALVDFTGGIGEFIIIKDYAENSGRLFKLLLRTFKMNSLVCCNLGVSRDVNLF